MALSGTGIASGGWYAPLILSTASNLPISVSAWIRMPPIVDPFTTDFTGDFDAVPPNTTFFSLSSDDSAGANATMACAYFNGSLYVDAYDDAASAEGGVWAALVPPSMAWQHVCIQWINSSTWNLWLNGVQLATSSFGTTLGTATFRQVRAGWASLSANEPAFTTYAGVAEISAWSGTFLADEIGELARGENPLNINGGRLRAYYKLRDSFAGQAPGNLIGMAPKAIRTNPIWTDHPPVVRAHTLNFILRSQAQQASGNPWSADFSVDFGAGPHLVSGLDVTQDAQTLAATGASTVIGRLAVAQSA